MHRLEPFMPRFSRWVVFFFFFSFFIFYFLFFIFSFPSLFFPSLFYPLTYSQQALSMFQHFPESRGDQNSKRQGGKGERGLVSCCKIIRTRKRSRHIRRTKSALPANIIQNRREDSCKACKTWLYSSVSPTPYHILSHWYLKISGRTTWQPCGLIPIRLLANTTQTTFEY